MRNLIITTDKDKWVSFLIRVNWLIAVAYYIAVPIIHNASVTQAITAVGCLFSTFVWLFSMRQMYVADMLAFFVCASVLIIKAIFGQSYTTVNGLYSILAFINVLGLFVTYKNITIQKKDFDFIYRISVCLTLLFFVLSFTGVAYKMETSEGIRYLNALVLNLNNPNAAAMHFYGLLCIIMINLKRQKHLWFNITLCAVLVYLIMRTQCRSCIIASVVLIVYYVWFRNRTIPKVVVGFAVLLPIFILILYMALYRSGFHDVVFLENKTLFSGRQTIYMRVFSLINTPFTVMFGPVFKEYFFNAHNAFLSVFASVGIVGTIPYFYFLVRSMLDIRKYSNVATMCFIGLCVQACAEAAMFVGNFPFHMFLLLFLVLGRYRDDESDDHRLEAAE